MAQNIPVILGCGFTRGSSWNSGEANGYYVMPKNVGNYHSAQNLNWACVLDRKDPTGKPVFMAAAPDSTTVPPGLDQYLNDQYILLWVSGAFVTSLPQGALYAMLDKNGGGTQLNRMEAMTSQLACGVNANVVYLMASVPGTGLPGFEFLEVQSNSSTNPQSGDPVYSLKNGPYLLTFDMMPTEGGTYTPVQFGS